MVFDVYNGPFDPSPPLASAGYRNIAEIFSSPYRMVLTATFGREEGLHAELNRLLGGKVLKKRVRELTSKHHSPFRLEKIAVELTDGEQAEYEQNKSIFSD